MNMKLSAIFRLSSVSIFVVSVSASFDAWSGWRCDSTLISKPDIKFSAPILAGRDAPIGSLLISKQTAISANVTASRGEFYTQLIPMTAYTGVKYGVARIYKTNVNGVGIAYRTDLDDGHGASLAGSKLPLFATGVSSGTLYYDLVKYGPIDSGVISGDQLDLRYVCLGVTNSISYGSVVSIAGGASVIVNSCSVTKTAINVPMGQVNRSAFTGVGIPVNEQDFTVPLDCDVGTRVNITIDGTADGSGVAGVLALDSSATDTVAGGIGLQVLHNNTPVTLGAPIAIGSAPADGPYSVPLTARYYQREPTVTAGQANSTATFTMTYN